MHADSQLPPARDFAPVIVSGDVDLGSALRELQCSPQPAVRLLHPIEAVEAWCVSEPRRAGPRAILLGSGFPRFDFSVLEHPSRCLAAARIEGLQGRPEVRPSSDLEPPLLDCTG